MSLIESIEVHIATNSTSATTKDPVYVGVVTKNMGAREFPLRYQKAGIEFFAGSTYKFGFGAVIDPAKYPPAWDSVGNGSNGLSAYPLEVAPGGQFDVRVYIRKEPVSANGEADSALVLGDVSVALRMDDGEAFFYRSRYPTNEQPSIIRLANENGQIAYLYPV
ncbi:MAG: hypothetical protein K0Q78_1236 [Cellvibrio sp.]|jgi:hypothetical protein|nr:hypothetical protein [Cellvibrio sp.]